MGDESSGAQGSFEPRNRRVLALMPHPDDAEILCGGTLIRLRGLGFETHVATMTPGDKGSPTLPAEQIAAIRQEEARLGAEALGAASYTCLGFKDVEIVFDVPSRRKVVEMVRRIDPFLVITTPPWDYMFDHEITSMLVRDACFSASIRNFAAEGSSPVTQGVPFLYYTDAVEGCDILGDPARVSCIVDISRQIDQKAGALMCHESQREWLRRQHGMDNYIDSMRQWSAKRGAEAGVAFGEAFCQHLGHPHPRADALGELLGAIPVRAGQPHQRQP